MFDALTLVCLVHGRRSVGGQGDTSPYFLGVDSFFLFEELLILTVSLCIIGVHCSNFREIWSVNSLENY